MPPETAQALLAEARAALQRAGLPAAALDARLLLQAAAGLSHEALIAAPEAAVAAEAAARFRAMLARRLAREPVSRIFGEREFYGRGFRVSPDVLDPRPDTETLVDGALPPAGGNCRILDIGTGSGAIIVTLLAERPEATGVATDISAAALAVAAENARRHGVEGRLRLVQGSWYAEMAERFDLIVSNPPYIAEGDIAGLGPEVRAYDPILALSGGADGLDAYRAIAAGAGAHLRPGGQAMVEIGAGQAEAVAAIFAAAGFRLCEARRDLAGHVRVLRFS